MPNYVDNQLWDSVEAGYRAADRQRAHKLGDAQVAEAHSASKQQQMAKDIYLPAALTKDLKEAPWEKVGLGASKLELPDPMKAFGGMGSDDETGGLISIITAAIIAQEKSSSNIWSVLWKQASESMFQQVAFAPIIGDAIKGSYTAAANATLQEAAQNKADAIINFVGFGMTILMAAGMEWKDPDQKLPDSDENAIVDNTPGKSLAENTDASAADAAKKVRNTLQNDKDGILKSAGKSIAKGGRNITRSMQYTRTFTGFLRKLESNAVQSMQLLTRGTQTLVDSGYQTAKASYQIQQGVQDAISKEAEQFAQFYGQDFSRTDSLGNATQQYFDFGIQTIKSAADTITQTVTSMFRS